MAEEPTLLRKTRKRSKYPLHWIVIPSTLVMAAGLGAWWMFRTPANDGPFVLPGYITSLADFDRESARFYGQATAGSAAREKFDLAAQAMSRHDFTGAAALLEACSKEAALPVVFNDMGVLYAKIVDRSRTLNAFREALARDASYGPTRQNLERLKGLNLSTSVYPVTREIEPNNTLPQANLISLDKPVDAEIAANVDDIDCYRVNAPAPPRDLMQIDVTNGSQTLAPNLGIYDDNLVALPPGPTSRPAGNSITSRVSAPPNSTVYFKVWGSEGSRGPYTLTVRVLKAFDRFEPNDDVFNATKIELGQPIEANIMDERDTDFYSFFAPRTGTVTVDVQNRSTTLIPALTTYTPDKRTSGFGPDIRTPGAALRHTMAVLENQTYYVQVWSQGDSAGDYTLTIQ